jgi:acyl carrier protein
LKTREQIFHELQDTISHLFEIPKNEITESSHFYDDLHLDSIDAVDLISHLQTMIGERVNPEDFKQIRTVSDVIDVTEKLIQNKKC